MRRRFVRLVVAIVSVAGLVGVDVPRAEGVTYSFALMIGTLTTANGLGYPCVGPSGTFDSLLCAERMVNMHPPQGDVTPTLLTRTLTLAGALNLVPSVALDAHHNRQTIVGLGATVCINGVANAAKPGKAPLHVDRCSFVIVPHPLNTVAGNCRVFTGQMVQDFLDALGNVFRVDMNFTSFGSLLLITGHVYKLGSSQTGKLSGTIDWTPVPYTPSLGNSCERKTATSFTYSGWLTFVTI